MKYNVEKMIAELCPTGVLYCEMGKLAQIGTGKSNGNEAEDNGEYPFFIRSPIVKRKNCYEYDEEAIIIPGEGGVGDIFHYINGKYALHQRVYRIHFTTKDVDTRFMYYYLSANFKVFIQRKAVNATVTSIRKPMIEQFLSPSPLSPSSKRSSVFWTHSPTSRQNSWQNSRRDGSSMSIIGMSC